MRIRDAESGRGRAAAVVVASGSSSGMGGEREGLGEVGISLFFRVLVGFFVDGGLEILVD